MHPKQIAVLGLGYVGCVSAASLASLGHIVVGADTDEFKVSQVRAGRAPFTNRVWRSWLPSRWRPDA